MEDYGLRLYGHGVVLRGIGRSPGSESERGAKRGRIAAHSYSSQRRLEFLAANLGGLFRSLLTLTYHASVESWENDAERNARIVARSKQDLNRFLCAVRRELGEYLWVQEFQRRGVVHYHLMSTREVGEERIGVAWCRATDALSDADAVRYAVKVEPIGCERAARGYLGRYLGKARQKVLPQGVERAGRWWGRSRGLRLVPLVEVVSREWETKFKRYPGTRIVRCVRKYLSKVFGFKFRGGAVVDWGGALALRVSDVVGRLRTFYGGSEGASSATNGDQKAVNTGGGE